MTDLNKLYAMEREYRAENEPEVADDLLAAAAGVETARDRAVELERLLASREAELASIRAQRDDAAAAMLAVLRPELERMVETLVVHGATVEDLRSRLDVIEVETPDLSLAIRQEVREMILDGDISISVDVM